MLVIVLVLITSLTLSLPTVSFQFYVLSNNASMETFNALLNEEHAQLLEVFYMHYSILSFYISKSKH
jgi:hypothetical protein